jgi:Flp pilus assembly protein TadD
MVRALRAQPGHPAATTNLAALSRLTGSYDTAETLLRWRATRRTPAHG